MGDASQAREELLARWVQLHDLAEGLQRDLRRAPAGAFAGGEGRAADIALDFVLSVLTNDRPRCHEPPRPDETNAPVRAAVVAGAGQRQRVRAVTVD